MLIKIPELSLVALIGPSGCGKSTFAAKKFLSAEVLSSDYCRMLVSNDENSFEATNDAFDILYHIVEKRLARGKLTVIDATNVQASARKRIVEVARQYHVIPVALVFNLPLTVCVERTKSRKDREFGPHVLPQQHRLMRKSIAGLKREGFRHIYEFNSEETVEIAQIVREPLYNNKRNERGPFDIIGDIHGCFDELRELLSRMGYIVDESTTDSGDIDFIVTPPDGRKAVFLGDLVDRGPKVPDVLRLVMSMVARGTAFCVPGNHDIKLKRALDGRDVRVAHGLAESLDQLGREKPEFRAQVVEFIDNLVSHYVFDQGRLVVAHAGMPQEMQGRGSGRVRDFALYGETTGETDEFGLPVRYKWAQDYRGEAMVVYGHTPVPEPERLNRTVNIDTGCVFGGRLSALRYPEDEILSVNAARVYCEPVRPLAPSVEVKLTAQQQYEEVLHIADIFGKRIIDTTLLHNITIREEQSAPALEAMSRFAANPKWLIYLPPTMSPSETSKREGYLEHPDQAFDYYREHHVGRVICEEKHMGSRAVVVLCRDEAVALKRFGVRDEGIGIIYTRTGRRFFNEAELEQQFLLEISKALTASNFWERHQTDWVCLDCELMPWSAKALELLRIQYAAVGAAATAALPEAIDLLNAAMGRNIDGAEDIRNEFEARLALTRNFVDAYRRYCWDVTSLADYRLAPFHILATEGAVHTDKSHEWHMKELHELAHSGATDIIKATRYIIIDPANEQDVMHGNEWWEELTSGGGEGMVVKPLEFVAISKSRPVQPALKSRGREYLRIIYGPDYTLPENLAKLRVRGLGKKRSLALREFALGLEGLRRFVLNEPLRRVHECVFGVLALESEPVDPRL